MRGFLLLVLVCLASTLQAAVVNHGGTDVSSGGTDSIINADGNGLNLDVSHTGGFTSPNVTLDYAGYTIGGDNERFGWSFTVASGFFHTSDMALRVEATNGTFDAGIGHQGIIGNAASDMFIESDGTFSDFGPEWSLVGNKLEWTSGLVSPFDSGTNSDTSNFVPNVVGASYVEITRPQLLDFSGVQTDEFDLDIKSSIISAVPEPSAAFFVLGVGCVAMMRRGRRRNV